MDLHEQALRRGQVFGIAGLIVAVLSAFAWLPLNLGAAGLSLALSVAAILHGERTYAVITPLVVGAVLMFLSPITLGMIWGLAQHGNPGPLLLVLAFLAAPFGAIAYDNAQREGAAGPGGARPSIIPAELQNLAGRFSGATTTTGLRMSLIPQPAGRPFSVDYQDLMRGRSITLGRRSTSDVVVQGDTVSREHARIAVVPGLGAAICDLRSANGTFVDGQRIGEDYVSLAGVKRIRLGTCEISVELPDETR